MFSEKELAQRHLSDHLVSDNFVSMPFRSDRPFDYIKFEHFLMQQLPETIFRAKGILWFKDQPQRYIFQLAGKRCSLSPDNQTPPEQNQLIFIGHKLSPLQIQQQLINCLAIAWSDASGCSVLNGLGLPKVPIVAYGHRWRYFLLCRLLTSGIVYNRRRIE